MDYEQVDVASHETMMSEHLGRLDASDIADFYVLGYMLQKEAALDQPSADDARPDITRQFNTKVNELTLVGVCTLSRELLGNGFSIGIEDISNDEAIMALSNELDTASNPYLTEESMQLYANRKHCAAKSIRCPTVIGATFTGLRIAALEALQNQDFSQTAEIASMTGHIATKLFEAIGRLDLANMYRHHEDKDARVDAKVGNWINFSELVEQAGNELLGGAPYGTMLSVVDQMIHAQHGGSLTKASMLDRSSRHPALAKQLLDSKDFSTNYLIELFASDEIRSFAHSAPELSPFSASKLGILDTPELADISGKAKGLHILKLLGYKVPWYIHFDHSTSSHWGEYVVSSYGYDDTTRWAVRSSANLEDSSSASFAGIFETVLDVPTSQINKAAHTVQSSGYSEKVNAYCAVHGINPGDLKLEFIAQEFKEPIWSGVWIGSSNGGILEWVDGRGEKLVDGSVTPNREIHGQDPSELKNEDGRFVSEICREIEERVGQSLDLEFAMTEDGLQWVQMRPVTVAHRANIRQSFDSSKPFEGRTLSDGFAQGLSYRGHSEETTKPTTDEALIFVGEDTRDDKWMKTPNLSGIVTRNGGSLSHAAIVSREMGIPFIAGIDVDQIPEGAFIEVNGETGVVTPHSVPKLTLRALARRFRALKK